VVKVAAATASTLSNNHGLARGRRDRPARSSMP
jgi:hypothetical protein